ncbi:type II toxin-antitoxin system HicB family antitoxin [Halomarina pelagica]|uniref:type II toxin-antitoxin system HicB family antitoxin n=1 Tax=Halomarina pelagica TaxID=2961599 RepID=UPI0020C4AE2D|nr:type II toxin-antitoxin system HicB family antitoxin [Halomarina sp. BND7]
MEGGNMGITRRITLEREESGWWVAYDEDQEVTSQGRTRVDALRDLDGVIALLNDEGHSPTDAELLDAGIAPDDNRPGEDLPDVLQGG